MNATCGSVTLRATDAKVKWLPTCAPTSAKAVCVSGAICTTSATNPPACARRCSRSGSTDPTCRGSETKGYRASGEGVHAPQGDICFASQHPLHRRLREVLTGHLQHDARSL